MMTTMLDAKRAGVSKRPFPACFQVMATSAVETKDRVFQAVEESGYRPNLLARNLSAKEYSDASSDQHALPWHLF